MRGLRKTLRKKRKQIGGAYSFANPDDACLQLAKATDYGQAKKMYTYAGIKFHPDKGGDTEQFQKLGHCFETFWPYKPTNTQAETARYKREIYLQEKDPQSAPPRQSARQQAARQQAAQEAEQRTREEEAQQRAKEEEEAQRRANEEEPAREPQRRAAQPPQPASPPPPPRHSAREQATREQAAREQAEREASRESYAKWKAAREQATREQATREQAAREKADKESTHFSRMKYASQQAAQKRYDKEAAEAAIREAERKKVAAEKAAQIRDEQRKAKKKADSRKAKDKEDKEKRDAYTKAVRSKNSDAYFYDMDIDAVSKEDIRKNKLKAFQYYTGKYPALGSKMFIDPEYYSPIIEQILNGDSSNHEKLLKELSNYNSPAVERHYRRFGGSSRGRLPSLPTRRVRRFSSSKKRRYTHRRLA